MTVSAVWVLHGINTPSNFYSVVRDATPAPLADVLAEFAAGHPQPLFTAVRGVKPEVVFTTHQVGTAIAECGLLGADLSGGNTDLYYKLATDHGSREAAASTVHLRLRMANAFMYIRRIQAQHRQNATCELRICAPYDGTNAPIVPAGSVALSGTPAVPELFTLGPTTDVNGSPVTGNQELTIELNPDVFEEGDDGDLFDTFCGIRSVSPTIMLRGLDVSQWAGVGLTGTALTALATYLRRKTSDGGNVANGTASHVKVSASAGLITVDNSNGGGNDGAQLGLRITPRAANSSSNAITLAASSAIT